MFDLFIKQKLYKRVENRMRFDLLLSSPSDKISPSELPSDIFMSHLATQLDYFVGEFQALQLIVLVAFCVVE